jgi:CubicO group peptidase (beta-lactamase class C family)
VSLLPISSPGAQGVLAEGVQEFLDALENAPEVEPHSLVVLRHGSIVAAGWWLPYTAHRPQLLYSLSKIFTATAAALAVPDGRLGLEDPVIDYFPELQPKLTGSRAEQMLVRHLASMCTGHTEDTAAQVFAAGVEDPVLNFLLLPPEQEPGIFLLQPAGDLHPGGHRPAGHGRDSGPVPIKTPLRQIGDRQAEMAPGRDGPRHWL